MPEPYLPDKNRSFDPKDPNPCEGCSNCCEYMSMEIDQPKSVDDFDALVWYLLHKDVWVYIDDDTDWYVQFNTPCEKLAFRRCTYYVNRPRVCREYEPADCVRYGGGEPEKFLFKNEQDLFQWMARKRPRTFEKLCRKISLPVEEALNCPATA